MPSSTKHLAEKQASIWGSTLRGWTPDCSPNFLLRRPPAATPLRLRRSRKFYRFLSISTLLSIWHSARHHPHIFILSVPRHALGHSLRHSKYFSRKGYLSVAFGASQSFLTSRFLSAWHRRIPLLWRSSGTKLFCEFFVANLRQSIFGWREPKEFKKRHLSPQPMAMRSAHNFHLKKNSIESGVLGRLSKI